MAVAPGEYISVLHCKSLHWWKLQFCTHG
jgi:hypothetical protein